MKIRNPLAIRLIAFILSIVLRLWMSTLRVRRHPLRVNVGPWNNNGRYIYLGWHENLVVAAGLFARAGIAGLVSQHRDGELITQVIHLMGGRTVRGSTTRGGERALRDMLSRIKETSLAITPDGPRGPRRKVQDGAIYLASRSGIEVVATGLAIHRAWRANSWDKLVLPKPFSRVDIVVDEPMMIPAGLSREQLEPYRQRCERRLQELHDLAQAIAEGKASPPSPKEKPAADTQPPVN